jgi:hypothetical protein
MLAMAVDERGHRLDLHYIDAAPHQGKTFGAKIDDRRRERELAVEPGLGGRRMPRLSAAAPSETEYAPIRFPRLCHRRPDSLAHRYS